MSNKRPFSADYVFRHFTHEGWFLLCPVWVNTGDGNVVPRNHVPGAWFDLQMLALAAINSLRARFGAQPLEQACSLGSRIGHGRGSR